MKSEFTFFTKEAIIAFLGNYGKEKSKDYEFAAALIVHRFCEKRWGADCWIGIRIKSKYLKSLPAYNSQREITLVEIAELLRKGNDEDSLVDFVVAKRVSMQKAQGMIFQTKRFGIGKKTKDTDALVNYINSLAKRCGKADTNLLVCLDDYVTVNFATFNDKFNAASFPFNRLLFTWVLSDDVFLQDIYPKGEREVFKMNELFQVT